MAKRKSIDRQITEWVNGLTSEQMIRMYQMIDPLSPEQQSELDKLSDDDLLEALRS